MIPTTLILTSSFVLNLLPVDNTRGLSVQKETEVRNYSTVSVGLKLGPSHKNQGNTSDITQNIHPGPETKVLEIPSEWFSETPLEMEDWMKSPKIWTNNKD